MLRVLILVGIASVLGACANPRGVMVPVAGRPLGRAKSICSSPQPGGESIRRSCSPAIVDPLRRSATSQSRFRPTLLARLERCSGRGRCPATLPPTSSRSRLTSLTGRRRSPGFTGPCAQSRAARCWSSSMVLTAALRRVSRSLKSCTTRMPRSSPSLFTWPSRGSVLAYGYDRESTAYSRNAFEGMLTAISAIQPLARSPILAHSMGSSLALETLRQMAIRDGRVAPKNRNVLLAAPDVDVDLARQAIIDMGPRAKRPAFTLFVSQDDRALAISRRVWGSEARLGSINPEQEPYRTQLEQANITVLDLTKLKDGDALNHGKFAASPEVVQLIGQRLAAGQTVRIHVSDWEIASSRWLRARPPQSERRRASPWLRRWRLSIPKHDEAWEVILRSSGSRRPIPWRLE